MNFRFRYVWFLTVLPILLGFLVAEFFVFYRNQDVLFELVVTILLYLPFFAFVIRLDSFLLLRLNQESLMIWGKKYRFTELDSIVEKETKKGKVILLTINKRQYRVWYTQYKEGLLLKKQLLSYTDHCL